MVPMELICQNCGHRTTGEANAFGWGPDCPSCREDILMTAEKYVKEYGPRCERCGQHHHEGREVADRTEKETVWICDGCCAELDDETPEHVRLGLPLTGPL